jgi:UDP-N-acetylmuramoyl-tripeptide--D-alanyl-D-alanine ligase
VIDVAYEEIAQLRLGRLEGGGPGETVVAIGADSRLVERGHLFVALNTGVEYVEDARGRGAMTLVPDDQHAALAALASLVRGKSSARVVAVVGSTGKTSTKDILGALCGAVVPTIAADASLNNEIGLPLTVLRLEPETDVLVTEMGMRGLGQIADLCRIARPDLAVVTHIGPEHLELVGSVENVARANAEAIEALPAGGTAVVPADAPELERFLRRDDIVLRRFEGRDVARVGARWRFTVDGTSVELELPFGQRHMMENTLAALTAYDALGLPLQRAQEGADRIVLSRWRGESLPLSGGGFVVNDAYNANPTSMRAALVDLVERAGTRRRVAVLGGMAELGDAAEAHHREIGGLARELDVEIIAVGELGRLYDADCWVEDADQALAAAREIVRPGDAVLVKASRAVGLEGIPSRLANFAEEWST